MEPAREIVPAIESVERNNFMLPADWIVVNEVHSTCEAFNESFRSPPPPFRRGQSGRRTKYRCSRCGRYGHNKRTCHGPLP
ncbi:hypothetical protein LWI28_019243 [Acer negundo]|uniref:CCHC-type domain-containing protein n=1 Tax=Acer negundo TaxID=4023 RepID=A0AAD5IZY5_ACENE|nr:hypothetical protein LWI28_019243 [Acer negundo]KAK4848974.1 hypothetical protein QYF36_019302 [Acer negundo]